MGLNQEESALSQPARSGRLGRTAWLVLVIGVALCSIMLGITHFLGPLSRGDADISSAGIG